MKIESDSIDDLLHDTYKYIIENGKENIPKKGENLEVQGCELLLKNPIARVSRSESRGLIFSCLGELIWYLSGSNDVEPIQYYLPKYRGFSEDDGTVYGGYGKRLFNMHGQYNQIERVIKQLKNRPSTRQAVIQLFDSSDLSGEYKDIPCTLNLQFILRENKLSLFTMMRSNDAYIGLPHDIFVFTMLQELIASELECDLGFYHHYVVSLHIYNKDLKKVKDFIKEDFMSNKSIMETMPAKSFSNFITDIIDIEEKIRKGRIIKLECMPIFPSYWQDILYLLLFFKITKENEISIDTEDIRSEIKNVNYNNLIKKRVNRIS